MLIALFISGLLLGSFANVCIYRLPREESLLYPSSHCIHCGKPIRWRDNIPLVSFIMLKARCRHCRAAISSRYFMIELVLAILFALGYCFFQHSKNYILLILYLWLIFNWVVITVIDYLHRIIPDELSLSLIVFGWLIAAWNPLLGANGHGRLLQSFSASMGSGVAMIFLAWLGEKIFKKEALGGGDIKLLAGYGAVLGWGGAAASLILGSFIGGLAGLALMAMGKKKLGQTIPFGPFLNIGATVGLFFPGWWHYFFPAFNAF